MTRRKQLVFDICGEKNELLKCQQSEMSDMSARFPFNVHFPFSLQRARERFICVCVLN